MTAINVLQGKCALITGSTQGLGLAAAKRFAAAGCNVVIHGLGDEREMEDVLQTVQKRMSGYVREIEAHAAPATGEFERFFIKHC